MRCLDWPVGVCSWSLGNDFEKIVKAGVDCVHLAIAPALANKGSQYLAEVAKKYPQGSRVKGKVVSVVPYGAFVQLEAGVARGEVAARLAVDEIAGVLGI